MFWIVLITVLLVAVIAYLIFRWGERYELGKIKDKVQRVELNILNKLEYERNTISHDGVVFGQLPKETVQGAGYAVQKIYEMLDKEGPEIDEELANFFRKIAARLKHRSMV